MTSEEKLDEVLEQYPHIWKSKSAFLGYIRGGVRRSLWNRAPQKIEFIKKNRIKIPNPNPRGKVAEVWGARCALTGLVLPLKDLEIDHKEGNHSLSEIGDIQSFIEAICLVTEKDLQFVSKDAHKSKSYADKHGISFKEAVATREAIELIKTKQDKIFLEGVGVAPASTQKARREQIIKYLTEKDE